MVEIRKWTVECPRPNFQLIRRQYNLTSLEKVCVLDIEAVKVAAPRSWPVANRFKPIMVGLGYWPDEAYDELVVEIIGGEDEAKLIDATDLALGSFGAAMFNATRDFDRNVLEGRWVSARKAFWNGTNEWPTLERDVEDFNWINVRKEIDLTPVPRVGDITGKDVLKLGLSEPTWKHNRLDVIELGERVAKRWK